MGKVAILYKEFAWFKSEPPSTATFFRSIEEETDYLKIKSFLQEKININVDRTKAQIA